MWEPCVDNKNVSVERRMNMGLDMYLYRRKKYRENDPEYNELVKDSIKEVMYWRKANQIRQWFVKNTGYDGDANCEDHELTKDQLIQLRDDCLEVVHDTRLANEVMPISTGFFFGSDKYDTWYFEELKDTAEKLNKIIEETDWEKETIDYFEWW